MNSQLKALGLGLFAVFATSGLLVAGAQAQVKITTGASPAWITGSQVGSAKFTIENGGRFCRAWNPTSPRQ
jgi:hypothetical protein